MRARIEVLVAELTPELQLGCMLPMTELDGLRYRRPVVCANDRNGHSEQRHDQRPEQEQSRAAAPAVSTHGSKELSESSLNHAACASGSRTTSTADSPSSRIGQSAYRIGRRTVVPCDYSGYGDRDGLSGGGRWGICPAGTPVHRQGWVISPSYPAGRPGGGPGRSRGRAGTGHDAGAFTRRNCSRYPAVASPD